MKILIAEDDPVSRKVLEANLTKAGHTVVTAVDGTEALEVLSTQTDIHMAVLDWMMPGVDGVEVCRTVRAKLSDTFLYIIILTAKASNEDVVTGLEAGADDYITKPFSAEELRARVKSGERIVNLENSLRRRIDDLQIALDHVKQLEKIIPICAWCKRVRDDSEYWRDVEDYFLQYANTSFTHSICPNCLQKKFAELANT